MPILRVNAAVEDYLGVAGGVAALAGAAAATYYLTRPLPPPPGPARTCQSVPGPGEPEGPEGARVSKLWPAAKEGKFMRYIYDDAKTLFEVFRRGVRESNNGPCLGWRDGPGGAYLWLSYNEALLRARNFGSGLVASGLAPGPSTYVGIYAKNCPEWVLTEQGLYSQSMVIVPLYDTLGPEACQFILETTRLSTVVCGDDKKLAQLLDFAPKCRSLKLLIAIQPPSKELVQKAAQLGITIQRFEAIEGQGAASGLGERPPRASDLSCINFTSGTTGMPKGVMLTHENIVAAVSATLLNLAEHRPNKDDIMLSFLPLAHMLERCCEVAVYIAGGAVGFYGGDIKHLADDYRALRPTITPSVPRLLNKVYDKTMAGVSGSGVKKLLFNLALASKTKDLKRGIVRRNTLWDALVFRKVADAMGGRLRLLVVGSAPLAGQVLTFARCALGCAIVEGYGQTESVAPATLTVQGEWRPEHVGPPLASNAIKLCDVEEMDYYARNNQGEVCIRGASVFQGYFKDSAKTREVKDDQGWLHTGDIGEWLPNGTLKIIDRKKHIFKLSQGEYIAPEKIENIYVRSNFVAQVFVHGLSLKSSIVAVVVPECDTIKAWAREQNIPGTLSVLSEDSVVKDFILEDMLSLGREAGLHSFEQVKDIYLHPELFSIQNGLLTPTLKSKRPQLRKYFQPQLDELYHKLP